MEHFNQLTPAQAERLAILAEEAGEVIQVVGKILRHGYESCNPLIENPKTNRQLLETELGDLAFIVNKLWTDGDVNVTNIVTAAKAKAIKIVNWTHHQ